MSALIHVKGKQTWRFSVFIHFLAAFQLTLLLVVQVLAALGLCQS